MQLLLFDIDGTLLDAHGGGRRAVEEGLAALVGHPVPTAGISFSGKTDPQILREVLVRAGAAKPWLGERFGEALEAYRRTAEALWPSTRVTALPGAVALVERLAAEQDAFRLGLLTGNIRPMAYRKVGAIGLDRHFPFGAFGCDHEDRNCLPAVAVQRAESHIGRRFAPENVVVIGDTPRDVACARAFGARVVAVATGRFPREVLAKHAPDALLDDLSDAEAVLQALAA